VLSTAGCTKEVIWGAAVTVVVDVFRLVGAGPVPARSGFLHRYRKVDKSRRPMKKKQGVRFFFISGIKLVLDKLDHRCAIMPRWLIFIYANVFEKTYFMQIFVEYLKSISGSPVT
jgi:hypothetical protein